MAPLPRAALAPLGSRAVPGQLLTRYKGAVTLSTVHTPHRQPELAQAGLVALATQPRARAHQKPNLTPTPSDVIPPLPEVGQGSHPKAKRCDLGRGAQAETLLGLLRSHTQREVRAVRSHKPFRGDCIHLLPSPSKNTKGEEAF